VVLRAGGRRGDQTKAEEERRVREKLEEDELVGERGAAELELGADPNLAREDELEIGRRWEKAVAF